MSNQTNQENAYTVPDSVKDIKSMVRYVYDKLMKQGEQSLHDGGYCAYRGNNGLMCSAGLLINDDLYEKGMEDDTISEHIHLVEKSLPFSLQDSECELLCAVLVALQTAHDGGSTNFILLRNPNSKSPEKFRENLTVNFKKLVGGGLLPDIF